MGNVHMEAKQIHDRTEVGKHKSVADHLKALDAVAQQIENLPTFTSNDRAFLEELPAFPSEDGSKVLTATTSDGETTLSYEDASGAYSAGDYIDLTGDIISVNRALPYVGNSYRITSYDTSGEAKIKVTKLFGETVISETIVDHHDAGVAIPFDERFTIRYYNNWIYTNLVASNDHAAGWSKTWGFDQTVNFTESFDNSGDTLALVKQVDAIKNAIISASSFTDAQSKLSQL